MPLRVAIVTQAYHPAVGGVTEHVAGTARLIGWVSAAVRHVQSGYIYHYAFAMIIGLFLLITFFLKR